MKTRSCYYHNVNGRPGGARKVQRTLAFVKKTAGTLLPKNSFLGIEIIPWVSFQMLYKKGAYYAELLESKTFDITWTRCHLPKLLQLIKAAWNASDAASFMANAASVSVRWRKKNVAPVAARIAATPRAGTAPNRNSGTATIGTHYTQARTPPLKIKPPRTAWKF